MTTLGARLKDPRVRAWLALAFAFLLALTVLWPLAVSRDARHLSSYGSGSEDLSRFHAEMELVGADVASVLSTPHLLEGRDAAKTVLVIVGPERRYDPSEAASILEFLKAGGKVVLADESGFGTDIARAAGYAFGSQRVLDTKNYRGDPKLVVATARIENVDYRVVYNAPATVIPLSDAQPGDILSQSSAATYPDGSFLDKNGNDRIEISDEPGPFPLAIRTHVGAGTLVLLADTGLFMNEQWGLSDFDNARFLHALVGGLATGGSTIVLDESRHAPAPLLAPWENGVRTLGRLTTGPVAPGLLLAALVLGSLAAWRLTRPTDDWSRHHHDIGREVPVPAEVCPDLERAQRMARRRISERFNKSMEGVSAMTTEELIALTGDRTLSEAASGALRGDPAPLFRSFSRSTENAP